MKITQFYFGYFSDDSPAEKRRIGRRRDDLLLGIQSEVLENVARIIMTGTRIFTSAGGELSSFKIFLILDMLGIKMP